MSTHVTKLQLAKCNTQFEKKMADCLVRFQRESGLMFIIYRSCGLSIFRQKIFLQSHGFLIS